MYGLILVIHVIVSIILIAVILLQGGRGGLGETLGGAASQSLFGGGAKTVLTKFTAIGAGLFMVTCLTLAGLSTARGRSVIEEFPGQMPAVMPGVLPGAPSVPPAVPVAPAEGPSEQPAAAPAVQGPAAMPPAAEPSGTSSSTNQ